DGASVTLERMVVTNCSITGSDGGAIFLTGTSPTLTTLDSTLSSNTTDGKGGAIFLDQEVYFFALNTMVTGNQAASGGGMFLYSESTTSPNPTFVSRDSTFSHNQASEGGYYVGGGGAFLAGGTFSASRTSFLSNTATMAGGLYILNAAGGMEDSIVSSNTSTNWGGGMMVYNTPGTGSAFLCKDSEFSFNQAATDGACGGGILLVQGSLVTSGCTILTNSVPDGYGGGVSLVGGLSEGVDYTAIDTQISGNEALLGGGICVINSTFTALSDVSISGNAAQTGGGIALLQGGTIFAEEMELFGNTAQSGGGIAWMDRDPGDEDHTEISTNGNPWNPRQSQENPFSVDSSGNIQTTPVAQDPVQVYGNTGTVSENEMLYMLN
ncbi:MAG TPA: hypothetical protein P5560_14270, partial [Thermotogota bacterium]|nr:hypothetical protein [Thermotogota bacterium]